MVSPLPKEQLRSVYNNVASWYDWQHALLTFNSDQRGRQLVVSQTIYKGDQVIDVGSGTGSTALMAAESVGDSGKVVLYDFSEQMLNQAQLKAEERHLSHRIQLEQGDMTKLPYEDQRFDVALSTYSMCPLYDPKQAIIELYRVVKPGGKIGVAHSVEPTNPILQRLADWAERLYWNIPALSLGCRAISILPTLKEEGAKLIFKKRIGFPLWPFLVFVVQKPE
jgi:demethylmenaquinone methyltransferase/2-methoxy-6-polyprenyl-1,4-benzoquinol methylase